MNKLTYKIYSNFKNNKRVFLVLFAALVLGVLSGVYKFLKTPDFMIDLKKYSDEMLSFLAVDKIDKKCLFINYLLSNFKILIFIWLSGVFTFFIPISFWQIFLKGFRMGFVIAFFTTVYGFKGVCYSFVVNLTSFIFIIPVILIYAADRIKSFNGKKPKEKRKIFFSRKSFLKIFLIACFTIISAYIDAYIVFDILKFISKYFI